MKASTTIYANTLVMLNTSGTLEPAATGSTSKAVVGRANKQITSDASVTSWMPVQECEAKMTATGLAQANVGDMMYATDDLTITDTPVTNSVAVGPLTEYVSATNGWVWASWKNLGLLSDAVSRVTKSFTVPLASLADGDVLTFTPGFYGKVLSMEARVTTAVTTAAKASTLNLEIGTTDLTGGVLALTSANMTPVFARVAATAITGNNVFDADDVITLEAASTTTFVEGVIDLNIELADYLGVA
jgi:hypothetical protein